MSDRCFIDTNILVYAHDLSAGWKRQRAQIVLEQLWESGTGVLSTQVLQELCINLRRKANPPLSAKETGQLLQDYLSWEVIVNDATSTLRALELETRYKISFWDALILQAAESAGVTILYSEDLSDGQTYGSVRVIDPLTSSKQP